VIKLSPTDIITNEMLETKEFKELDQMLNDVVVKMKALECKMNDIRSNMVGKTISQLEEEINLWIDELDDLSWSI
jgi:hypothetical protein